MKTNKKIAIPTMILGILVIAGAFGIGKADAFGGCPGGGWGNRDSLIQKLVDRFSLNKSEVEAVFNEHREEQQAEMRSRKEGRLNQAVADGKITEEQKQAILKKMDEMKNRREELKDLSVEERHEEMEKHQEEMRKWMEENDLDLHQLGWGMRGGKGFYRGIKG